MYPPARKGTASPSGRSSTSSLMKVATFSFDRTVHVHCRAENTEGGISIWMSSLSFTWHERRTPMRASMREMCDFSVGSMAPPPSSTRTVHTPQLPFPPQAEGMKTSCAASVFSSVPPARAVMARSGSSLIRLVTSPEATRRDLAKSRSTTSIRTMSVNAMRPAAMVPTPIPSELDPAERHEAQRHQTHDDEGDAEPAETRRDVAVPEPLPDRGERDDGEPPPDARAEAVHRGLRE